MPDNGCLPGFLKLAEPARLASISQCRGPPSPPLPPPLCFLPHWLGAPAGRTYVLVPSDSSLARKVQVRGTKRSNLVDQFLPLQSGARLLWHWLSRGCPLSGQGRVPTMPSLQTLPCQLESLVWPGLRSRDGPPWRSRSIILDPQRPSLRLNFVDFREDVPLS